VEVERKEPWEGRVTADIRKVRQPGRTRGVELRFAPIVLKIPGPCRGEGLTAHSVASIVSAGSRRSLLIDLAGELHIA
jgi:hypothetical protein